MEKLKPSTVYNEYGDQILGCPKCREVIYFPFVGDTIEKPKYCRKCGCIFDWKE